MRIINMLFSVHIVDEEYRKLCNSVLPCEDLLKDIVITALKQFPIQIAHAEVRGFEKENE